MHSKLNICLLIVPNSTVILCHAKRNVFFIMREWWLQFTLNKAHGTLRENSFGVQFQKNINEDVIVWTRVNKRLKEKLIAQEKRREAQG